MHFSHRVQFVGPAFQIHAAGIMDTQAPSVGNILDEKFLEFLGVFSSIWTWLHQDDSRYPNIYLQ